MRNYPTQHASCALLRNGANLMSECTDRNTSTLQSNISPSHLGTTALPLEVFPRLQVWLIIFPCCATHHSVDLSFFIALLLSQNALWVNSVLLAFMYPVPSTQAQTQQVLSKEGMKRLGLMSCCKWVAVCNIIWSWVSLGKRTSSQWINSFSCGRNVRRIIYMFLFIKGWC